MNYISDVSSKDAKRLASDLGAAADVSHPAPSSPSIDGFN